MKLYEVLEEFEKLIDAYDLESADDVNALPPELFEQFEGLKLALNEKLGNVWAVIKNLQAEADALKAEKQRLSQRQQAAENKVSWLKSYVAFCLGEGTKWQSLDGSRKFSWRKSEAVEITQREAIPDYYRVVEWKPALSEIKKDIKSGATVPGAVISEHLNLQVK